MGTIGIDSLNDSAYLDGIDDVDTMIKGFMNPGGMITTATRSAAATSRATTSMYQSGMLPT
jgi:hypothetical protein